MDNSVERHLIGYYIYILRSKLLIEALISFYTTKVSDILQVYSCHRKKKTAHYLNLQQASGYMNGECQT